MRPAPTTSPPPEAGADSHDWDYVGSSAIAGMIYPGWGKFTMSVLINEGGIVHGSNRKSLLTAKIGNERSLFGINCSQFDALRKSCECSTFLDKIAGSRTIVHHHGRSLRNQEVTIHDGLGNVVTRRQAFFLPDSP